MSESDEELVTVVIDNGSGSIKAGFAGDDGPRSEREIVREIKEKFCYVAQDFEKEMLGSSAMTKTCTLPDLHDISLGNEIFRVPEILFIPSLADLDHASVHQLVYNAIMKCDIDLRLNLYSNIFLVGGSKMIPGFQLEERLQKELSALFPQKAKVKVNAWPERKYFVWIGGSMIASSSIFQQMWFTKKEYDEHGPSVVHKTCTK
ncbi:actin CyI, cytoplasmic-like [Strongylocentrotus purpuratus]|uniref:Uncharacterized protein n=1 Tax=Strongylocentrotus purpuratus TaxID=7668 RepID=A0A7M7SY12_STRPU|nr:actin CyI, cytoplasmic-like [Strongylocentrotus purpuratus]